MRQLGVAFSLLVVLAGPARAQYLGPIEPLLPYSPSDTLIVFERLASREGLAPGELNYRVHRCLPDGSIVPAPAVVLDARYFTADKDSIRREAARRKWGDRGREASIMEMASIVDTWETQMDNPEYFWVRRPCYGIAHQRWVGLGYPMLSGIALYDLRTGTASMHGAWSYVRILPDGTEPPLGWSYGSERSSIGLGVGLLDGGRHLVGSKYYEPVSDFFRPLPRQSPVILVYDYENSEQNQSSRGMLGRPLRLLRFDRASASLPVVASLPDCQQVYCIAVDAEGGILISGRYAAGPRLCRIDTARGFAVAWSDSLPAPPHRFFRWNLSNVSADRVLAACGSFTNERGERVLEAKLLNSRTLEAIWSGRLPGKSGWPRLAGDRVLISRVEDRPFDPETYVRVSDVRWDFYTFKPGPSGLRLVQDENPIEFVRSSADPRYDVFADDLDILAAIEGRGFLCWRGDSLTWLH